MMKYPKILTNFRNGESHNSVIPRTDFVNQWSKISSDLNSKTGFGAPICTLFEMEFLSFGLLI